MISKVNELSQGQSQVLSDAHIQKLQLTISNNEDSISTWDKPYSAVSRLLIDLFAEKPEDALSWIHAAVWQLHKEEIFKEAELGGEQQQGAAQRPLADPIQVEQSSYSLSPRVIDIDTQSSGSYNDIVCADETHTREVTANGSVCNEGDNHLPSHNGTGDWTCLDLDFGNATSQALSDNTLLSPQVPSLYPSGYQSSRPVDLLQYGVSEISAVSPNRPEVEHISPSMVTWQHRFKKGGARISGGNMVSLLSGGSRKSVSLRQSVGELLFRIDSDQNERLTCSALAPTAVFRCVWEAAFFLCLLFELWIVSLVLLFPQVDDVLAGGDTHCPTDLGLAVVCDLVLGFFWCDLVLNFFMGINLPEGSEMRLRTIHSEYLSFWFWIDFLSSSAAVACRVSPGSLQLCWNIVRMLRVLRMRRADDLALQLHVKLEHIPYTRVFLQMLRLHVALACLAHCDAILWAAVNSDSWAPLREEDTALVMDRYLEALSWAYGALVASTSSASARLEDWLLGIAISLQRVTFTVAVAVCLAWSIAQQSMLIPAETLKAESAKDMVLDYIRRRHVSAETARRVAVHLNNVTLVQQRVQAAKCSSSQFQLPESLQHQLNGELWKCRLLSFRLLACLTDRHGGFMEELIMLVFEQCHKPDDQLFMVGEPSHAAFLIISGVLIVNSSKSLTLEEYTEGMWTGEQAFLNPELLQSETVKCKVHSELLVVPANEFHSLLSRMELTDHFHELMKWKLWMGLCGRCGSFGEHFPADCPHFRGSWLSRKFSRINVRKRLSRRMSGGDTTLGNTDPALVRFMEEHGLERLMPFLYKYDVFGLDGLDKDKVSQICADEEAKSFKKELRTLKGVLEQLETCVALSTEEILAREKHSDHFLFLSHYKMEAGTEAALMREDFEKLMAESTRYASLVQDEQAIFIDTEGLRNLDDLVSHVKASRNLVLILTKGVLTRPWVLLEIVTAVRADICIVPVEIQRPGVSYQFPDEAYFTRLRSGSELDEAAQALLDEANICLSDVEDALRHVFKTIALPFSPHKSSRIRAAELGQVLKNCDLRGVPAKRSKTQNMTHLTQSWEVGAIGSQSNSSASAFDLGRKSGMPIRGGRSSWRLLKI